ncbi:hypothetical protein pqer_cds_476 [Pandoravirus quercus]|uniref:DUF5860 domain-containing protein n=1 Tax=Pandoravirus quercus TaxID=2107709 RepID=A0A2U7U8W9_9VIRU|nr:hypothetical protein pqer_cds_476 [Pandoravirus quercus]AVK74898.1 hypothetical protein pqer_cds_476 [Pandoravirus quercus]
MTAPSDSMKKAHAKKTHISHWHIDNPYPWQPQPRPSAPNNSNTDDGQDMSLSISPTTQPPACERGRLPSDSVLREMYGPLDQEDIDRLVQVSIALVVPHNWSPCDGAGAVGTGQSYVHLCATTKYIVDTITSEFASQIHLGRERRVALAVRRERHGWMLYWVAIPGADLPGTLITPAGTFGLPPDPSITAAVDATYPDMDSLSRSVVAGLCGAMSSHAQRWLPPHVLDYTLPQSLGVTTGNISESVRTLAKAIERTVGGARRLVLSPRPYKVCCGAILLSYTTEPADDNNDDDDDDDTVDSMEESTVDDGTSTTDTKALTLPPPSSQQQQATTQSPGALLGLYPDMTMREAIRVLSIADSLADVPHQWTAQPVGDVANTVHDLYAPLSPLKERADSIHRYVGGQQRVLLCALSVNGAYTHVRMAVERSVSMPRTQTADDLLDLYPDVTAREAIALGRVIRALTGTPTEWVASGSGHIFEGQGPFAPTESVAQRIADVVRPLVLSRSLAAASALHHAVLTIDRDGDTGDLVYRFAVVPTPRRIQT